MDKEMPLEDCINSVFNSYADNQKKKKLNNKASFSNGEVGHINRNTHRELISFQEL